MLITQTSFHFSSQCLFFQQPGYLQNLLNEMDLTSYAEQVENGRKTTNPAVTPMMTTLKSKNGNTYITYDYRDWGTLEEISKRNPPQYYELYHEGKITEKHYDDYPRD